MRLMREAQSDAMRLNIADAARAKGDNQIACRIYLRLVGDGTANPATVAARGVWLNSIKRHGRS